MTDKKDPYREKKNLSSIHVEFLAGTSIKAAAETMYHMHFEYGEADVTADFNGVRISMVNKDLHERLGKR